MTLKDNLYKIVDKKETPEGVLYDIHLIGESPIYGAHFPDMPITPGVCIVQIVEELLSDYLQRNLQISTIKSVKFLSVLKPSDEMIQIELFSVKQEKEKTTVQSTIKDYTGTVYSKISLTCNDIQTV